MDLDVALDDALKTLARAEEDAGRLKVFIDELRVEVAGLRAAIERQGVRQLELDGMDPSVEAGAVAAGWVHPVARMNRTDAVEHVLRELRGEPVSPKWLTETLNNCDRNDSDAAVSAALAHLQRTGRAHTVGRAQWVAGPGGFEPDEDDPFRTEKDDEDGSSLTEEPF